MVTVFAPRVPQRTARLARVPAVEEVLTVAAPAAEDQREWLGHFFDAEHAVLIRFALRVAHDRDEAFDIVQEAFLRALKSIGRFRRDEEAAMAWMYRVITNLARDRYRRRRVRELAGSLFHPRTAAADPAEAIVSEHSVRAALARLSTRQRAVIALCVYEGRTSAEAAAALGIREVTVRWHMKQARDRLASALGVQE